MPKARDQAADNETLLRQELAQLHHELRRARDALERGGSGAEAEKLVQRLGENIGLCQRELALLTDAQAPQQEST